MKNLTRFIIAAVAVAHSLLAGTSVHAMQQNNQAQLKIHDFTIASCSVLHEGLYQKSTNGTIPKVAIIPRTEAFRHSLEHGDLSDADIIVFQEWPYKSKPNEEQKKNEALVAGCKLQAILWNETLSSKPDFAVITTPERFRSNNDITAHGITIAYNTKKFNMLPNPKSSSHHALCVFLECTTLSGAKKRVGIVGCHFMPGAKGSGVQERQANAILRSAPQADAYIICGNLNWPRRFNKAAPFFKRQGFENCNIRQTHTCLSPALFEHQGTKQKQVRNLKETVDYMFYKGTINFQRYEPCSDGKQLIPCGHPGVDKRKENLYFFSNHKILKTKFRVEDNEQHQLIFQLEQHRELSRRIAHQRQETERRLEEKIRSLGGSPEAPQPREQETVETVDIIEITSEKPQLSVEDQDAIRNEIAFIKGGGLPFPFGLNLLEREISPDSQAPREEEEDKAVHMQLLMKEQDAMTDEIAKIENKGFQEGFPHTLRLLKREASKLETKIKELVAIVYA